MMDFVPDKPIFRQVADYCCQRILAGEWSADERIPSTKELAVNLAVNNRTVMKAYDDLSDAGVIYQRRGMGYYVAPDAEARLKELLRNEFIATIPDIIARMKLAGLSRLTIADGTWTAD